MSLPYDPLFDLSRILEDVDYQVRHQKMLGLTTLLKRLRNGLGFEMEPGSQSNYEAALRKNLASAIPGTPAGKALTKQGEEITRLRQKVAGLEAEIRRRADHPAGERDDVTVCPGMEYIATVLGILDNAEDGHVVLVPGRARYTRDRADVNGWRHEPLLTE